MKTILNVGSGLCGVLLLAACSSSSTTILGGDDAGQDAVSPGDAGDAGLKTDGAGDAGSDVAADAAGDGTSATDAGEEASPTADAGDAGADAGVTRHVLVTYNYSSPSTLFAVNLTTKAIDGTLVIGNNDAVTDTSNSLAPFLLNQEVDVVDRLSATTWGIAGSWSVALAGGDDGGNYANPYAVTVTTPDTAYVVRNDANQVDVIDLALAADAAAPEAPIDLSAVLQPGDFGGLVRPAAGVYVASSKRVYLVVQNLANLNYPLLCGSTSSAVTAIDTTTNTLVNLGGAGPGGSVPLRGVDPVILQQDVVGGRLLVFNYGCASNDGGAGSVNEKAGVDAFDLATSAVTTLLDTSNQDDAEPQELVYIDAHHAVVGFGYPSVAYLWDPTTTTLGAVLPNAPQTFDYDGRGNLVGANILTPDAGAATTDIVSMSLATGIVTTLQANVLPLPSGAFIASVGVWPRP